jgi:hypothetical protein
MVACRLLAVPPVLALCTYLFVVVRSIGRAPREAQVGMVASDLQQTGT